MLMVSVSAETNELIVGYGGDYEGQGWRIGTLPFHRVTRDAWIPARTAFALPFLSSVRRTSVQCAHGRRNEIQVFSVNRAGGSGLALDRIKVTTDGAGPVVRCLSFPADAWPVELASWYGGPEDLVVAWADARPNLDNGMGGEEVTVRVAFGRDIDAGVSSAFSESEALPGSVFSLGPDDTSLDLAGCFADGVHFVALFVRVSDAGEPGDHGTRFWRRRAGGPWEVLPVPPSLLRRGLRTGTCREREGRAEFFLVAEDGGLLQWTLNRDESLGWRDLVEVRPDGLRGFSPNPAVRPTVAGGCVVYTGYDGAVYRVLPWHLARNGAVAPTAPEGAPDVYFRAGWADGLLPIGTPDVDCLHMFGGLPLGWTYDRRGPFPKR
jgi:hypothetical protein